ncbi:MAG: hypothetical protein JWN70_2516 [Planctomycetaceae bacterium]|nr:hypothetical protein [Planctomycetaceae bacterium]
MSLLVACPNCEKTLKMKDEAAGKKVRCPDCATVISIPATSTDSDDDFANGLEETVSPQRKRRVPKDDDNFDDMPVLKPRSQKSSKKKANKLQSSETNWLLIGGCGGGGLVAILLVVMLVATTNQAPKVQEAPKVDVQVGEKDRVQSDVRSIINALYSGDVDTGLRFTSPKVIELMGGAAKAKSELTIAQSKIQSIGLKIESLTFPNDPTFMQTAGNQYVFVPTFATFSAPGGQRLESLNFQLGARVAGAPDWTYVEGSRVSNANVKALFPDFPVGAVFPGTYRKKL